MPHVHGTGLDTELVFYFTLAELKVSGQGKAGRPLLVELQLNEGRAADEATGIRADSRR